MQGLGSAEPRQVGGYRLLKRLGAGGMGDVYLARSDRGRTVAIKLVREELAAQEEFRARFRHEVEAARRVGGHWTAPVLDADTEAAVPWVAIGYVAGPSLRQVAGCEYGPLPERSVRTLAAGLAYALRDIHDAGLVHRDLKPANVLITIDGPRIIDFGIARALETVADGGLTRTGVLLGSPGFMAPEQVRSERITSACDIFSLGSVLVYAATGKMPFGTSQTRAHVLMYRIAHEEPDLRDMSGALASLVRDCLTKDPAARPDLAEVLQRTGAQDTVADGRSHKPWLPGPLVSQLGRHAVSLLDTETPELLVPPPPREPHPAKALAPDAASVSAPHLLPHQPSRKRRRIALLTATLVLALSAGSLLYTSMKEDHTHTIAKDGSVPTDFLGDWVATLASENQDSRDLHITPGDVGDKVLLIVGVGFSGKSIYHCAWEGELIETLDSNSAINVGPTKRVSGPNLGCSPGGPSTLRLLSKDKLRRESGDSKNYLDYTRAQ
ncbi:serine/threonine protein kinase [Streptomyces olivaceus]|uniref:serine/threonine-protein kinase n=1 Tax=Streptomyces olivaceus TaxID=47716 RepID=UPI001CCE1918|nr:serine/threonine-protein kinase [Streptomyces olivaceus]MBZ6173363.1 serine/threonine protein kinase [Streptomyces olivaceus]MBZ6179722.1 serine/threonine protein kinase [Streptomyces olivaceus]